MLKCIVTVLCGFPVTGYGCGFALFGFFPRVEMPSPHRLHMQRVVPLAKALLGC